MNPGAAIGITVGCACGFCLLIWVIRMSTYDSEKEPVHARRKDRREQAGKTVYRSPGVKARKVDVEANPPATPVNNSGHSTQPTAGTPGNSEHHPPTPRDGGKEERGNDLAGGIGGDNPDPEDSTTTRGSGASHGNDSAGPPPDQFPVSPVGTESENVSRPSRPVSSLSEGTSRGESRSGSTRAGRNGGRGGRGRERR